MENRIYYSILVSRCYHKTAYCSHVETFETSKEQMERYWYWLGRQQNDKTIIGVERSVEMRRFSFNENRKG